MDFPQPETRPVKTELTILLVPSIIIWLSVLLFFASPEPGGGNSFLRVVFLISTGLYIIACILSILAGIIYRDLRPLKYFGLSVVSHVMIILIIIVLNLKTVQATYSDF